MTKERIRSLEKILSAAIFTTFMGQIYIKPFASDFRLTLAVVFLNVIMLTFKDVKPLYTVNLVGVLMFLIRTSLFALGGEGPLSQGVMIFYPVLFFYSFYALLFILLEVRQWLKHPAILFVVLWICDSIPNLIEFFVRGDWRVIHLEEGIYTIVLIGLIRSILSVLLVYLSIYYLDVVKTRQNHKEFVEKIIMMANLKTELFFLKKSRNDIEETMKNSYQLYETLEYDENKAQALTISKDIHEIKKDYQRVISGIEKTVNLAPKYHMRMVNLIDIVIDANEKHASALGKNIRFKKKIQHNIRTQEYYCIISILNNLVVNAVEAIDYKGEIIIEVDQGQKQLILSVSDNGSGIDSDTIDLIYSPGYSTKFDEQTGIMSSGVGLTHVKHLVSDHFKGKLACKSLSGKGTHFTVSLPMHMVTKKETHNEF